MKTRQVREMMVAITDYATIHTDATIGEAILALENENKRHGDKEIVGILRSTDLFNTFFEMLAACKTL